VILVTTCDVHSANVTFFTKCRLHEISKKLHEM
jgi:hypothetical protein